MKLFENNIFDFVSSPNTNDNEANRINSTYLRIVLIVAITVIPVYIVFKRIEANSFHPADFILAGLAMFFIGLLYILKRGKILLAGILFLLAGWAGLTVMAGYADGVKDIAIVGYIVIIFLATLLTGIRFAFAITAMSIISVWIFGIIHVSDGYMPPGDSPLNYSRDYTVLFILVLTVIILFARSFRYSYERINKELQERTKAELKLSKNEVVLKEKNEELNNRNLQMIKMNEDLFTAKEKAEESDRLKTAFLNNISHEIRTPMNGIMGFLELLQQPDCENEKKTEYISVINSCTKELALLVNDLIDIAKIESGTVELLISEFDPIGILKDIEKEFSDSAMVKHLDFTINSDFSGLFVKSDAAKIKQVLYNLVSNAIKFTQNGSVNIKGWIDKNNIVFSVSDTGIGIKESDHKLIFDRFRQTEVGLNRSFGGSGLGLAISKGNISLLGGEIRLTSTSGKGSVFTFSVPVVFLEKSRDEKSQPRENDFSGIIKVLAVEDDDINFLYLKELFSGTNFEIIRAVNGKEAIRIFKKSDKFDVILMDLKMPVMNGYEATKSIKDINPDIPVLAVTAFDVQKDFLETYKTHFDGYVLKPIDKGDLLSKIFRVLE